MAVRTQIYEGLLWQQVIAERKLKPGDKLPPVLMIVLYNGEARWNAPEETAALIALPEHSSLWPWQPQIRYHLLDMGILQQPARSPNRTASPPCCSGWSRTTRRKR